MCFHCNYRVGNLAQLAQRVGGTAGGELSRIFSAVEVGNTAESTVIASLFPPNVPPPAALKPYPLLE